MVIYLFAPLKRKLVRDRLVVRISFGNVRMTGGKMTSHNANRCVEEIEANTASALVA